MKTLFPVLAVLLAISACSSGPNPDKASKSLMAGDEDFREKDYEAALDNYNDAVRANPGDPWAYLARGNAHIRLARMRRRETGMTSQEHESRALANYGQCLRLNPSVAEAFWNRAMIWAKRAAYKAAAEDLLRYAKIRNKDPLPHLHIGEIYENKFEDSAMLVRAMEHYEKFLTLGGQNEAVREKVEAWRELKKAAGMTDEPGKEPGKKPDNGKDPQPKIPDDQMAQKLFDQYKELFRTGKPEDRQAALGIIRELLEKYGHTKLVQEKKKYLEIILKNLGGDKKDD